MSDNPNPRGWRCRDVFVDLGSVAVAFRELEHRGNSDWAPITQVVVRGINGPRVLRITDDEHESLLNALEIYRSGR